MANDLDYKDIKFSVSKIGYSKIEQKTIFALMYFVMKLTQFILFTYQNKNLKKLYGFITNY